MNEEELQAIRERAENATPGPWDAVIGDAAGYPVYSVGSRYTGVAQLISAEFNAPDAQFIAHAREDIPALLAEVDAMREIVQAVADEQIGYSGYDPSGYCRCDPDFVEYDDDPARNYWQHKPECIITKARAILNK